MGGGQGLGTGWRPCASGWHRRAQPGCRGLAGLPGDMVTGTRAVPLLLLTTVGGWLGGAGHLGSLSPSPRRGRGWLRRGTVLGGQGPSH